MHRSRPTSAALVLKRVNLDLGAPQNAGDVLQACTYGREQNRRRRRCIGLSASDQREPQVKRGVCSCYRVVVSVYDDPAARNHRLDNLTTCDRRGWKMRGREDLAASRACSLFRLDSPMRNQSHCVLFARRTRPLSCVYRAHR
jgi:hypothetical protein